MACSRYAMLFSVSPFASIWLPFSNAACPLPAIFRSCTDTTYLFRVALESVCPEQILAENRFAGETKTMMKRKLRNLLPNPEAFIATCSQAGKSSPVNTSILGTNTQRKRRESVFVWAKVTARTNRGVNCPIGQQSHRAL